MKRNNNLLFLLILAFTWHSAYAKQILPDMINENCRNLTITIEEDSFSFCDPINKLSNDGFAVHDYGKYRFLIKTYTNSTILLSYANQRQWGFYSLLGVIVYSNSKDVIIDNVCRSGSALTSDYSNTLSFIEFLPEEKSLSRQYIYRDTIIRQNVDYSYYAKECWYEPSTFTATIDAILFGKTDKNTFSSECENCSILLP